METVGSVAGASVASGGVCVAVVVLVVVLNGDVEGRAECARPLSLCSPFSHVETVGDK